MRKTSKKTRDKLYWWRVVRFKKTPVADVGRVEAPDAETAKKIAIEKYDTRDPHIQSRLMVFRQ